MNSAKGVLSVPESFRGPYSVVLIVLSPGFIQAALATYMLTSELPKETDSRLFISWIFLGISEAHSQTMDHSAMSSRICSTVSRS